MNNDPRRVEARFGLETRFEVKPAPPAPFRAWHEDELENLKKRLLKERLDEVWDLESNRVVRRAANEAAALAWVTRYPLLVFPALFEEKAEVALEQAERQAEVRKLSRELLAV
jgi:hypothetical protein